MKYILLSTLFLCCALHAEEKTVKSEVASTEITIKIRGDRKFVEICKVTEIKDSVTNAVLATNRHREAIDVSTVDDKGAARSQATIDAEKAKVTASIGADLATKALAVEPAK